MLAILKINQAFSKRIYERIINPNLLEFTISIVGNKLIIHSNSITDLSAKKGLEF